MVIYKTTNLINGKIYVGQDKHNNPNYIGSGDLIKRAITKYGKENFTKEILCVCENQLELDKQERYFINHLNSLNHEVGYNISVGGRNGTTLNRKLSPETKERMSRAKIGIVFSPEHKKKLSEARKGVRLSEEHKLNISKAHKKLPHGPMSNDVKEKISKAKIGKSIPIEIKKKMSDAHKGSKNHFFGKTHSDETLLKNRKPIIQLTLFDVFIKEWCGVNLAAKELKIRQSDISGVLTGRYKKTHGFKFKYKK